MLQLKIANEYLPCSSFVLEPDPKTSKRHLYIIVTDNFKHVYKALHDQVGMKATVQLIANGQIIENGYYGLRRVHVYYDDIIKREVMFLDFVF